MSRPALSAMAAELSAELGAEYIVTTGADEHHGRDSIGICTHYSLAVYVRAPWAGVVLWQSSAPILRTDAEAIASIIADANQWLSVGRSLRYLGAQICQHCDHDGRFRLATDMEHELCAECLESAAERQEQRRHAEYYGGAS